MVPLEELESVTALKPLATYLGQIAAMGNLVEYEPGEVIFFEKRPEKFIYLVLKGEIALDIKVPDAENIEVLRVSAGELLGWSPLLGRRAMTATARAATVCRLAALEAAKVEERAEADPRFGMAFFRCLAASLADRLHATRLQLIPGRRQHSASVGGGTD
jgi:CRP-like cAMP-binding protein